MNRKVIPLQTLYYKDGSKINLYRCKKCKNNTTTLEIRLCNICLGDEY